MKTSFGNYFTGYDTSIFETSTLITDNLSGIESYTQAMWIAKEDIYVPLIIPEKDYFIKLGVDEEFYKSIEKNINDVFENSDYAEFYSLIAKEFKKKVNSANHYEYGVSALISQKIMEQCGGIIYPSVKSDGIGMNTAFLPEKFDKYFKLHEVVTGELYKFNNQILFTHTLIAEENASYPFKYKPVPKEISMNIQEILNLFLSRGLTKEEIIIELAEFIKRA